MGQVRTIPHAPVVPRRHQRRPGEEGRGPEPSEVGQRRLSKIQSVDQRMRLECNVGFRQLRTCVRTRPGQLCANKRRLQFKTRTLSDEQFEQEFP
jgi:hypothetical protein